MAATSMEGDLVPVQRELAQEETTQTQTEEVKVTNDGESGESGHGGPTVDDGPTPSVSGTSSPSRLAALTRKIVNLVASPLRQTNAGISINTVAQPPEMEVDDEISLRTRSQSSGGLVGDAEGLSISCSGTIMTIATTTTDQFFTPQASEEPLRPTTKDQGLSSESVPQGFSRSYSIDGHSPSMDEVGGMRPPVMTDLREFDPLGLMTFNSPPRPQRRRDPEGGNTALSENGHPSKCLLLDIDEGSPSRPPMTPTSVAKFSEREVQQLRRQYEERLERQGDLMQLEVSSLQDKYNHALRAAEEMRTLLVEYERTMAGLLETRRLHPERSEDMEAAEEERQRLAIETQSLRIAFSNLRQNYEENKRALESLRLSEQSLLSVVGQLRRELADSQRNYDMLLGHAQGRMQEANEELHRLRSGLEIELSATKAKLHKAELKVSSLEGALEGKTHENVELMTICDELIQKIDSQAAAAHPKSDAILSSLIGRGGRTARGES